MLSYDFNRLFSDYGAEGLAGRAVFQRDMATPDAYGGQSRPDWQPLTTVECVLYWDKSTGSRSANRVYVEEARTVPVSQGFLIVPSGTDVTTNDRISLLEDSSGTLVDGYFTITAVLNEGTHCEVYFTRAHLGS